MPTFPLLRGHLSRISLALTAAFAAGVVFVATDQGVRFAVETVIRRVEAQVVGHPPAPIDAPPPAEVRLTVDARHTLHPISPLIYGVAAADGEQLNATAARLNRWGGNPNTRYNWTLGSAWNAARDWEFRNYGGQTTAPSSAADKFISTNAALAAETVLTIPAIGWVAGDGRSGTHSIGVPIAGGAPISGGSAAIAGYDPTTNQRTTSVTSFARKSGLFADPPAVGSVPVYQDEWVHHLVDRFGPATAGGVRYYVVDNEPDLWSYTHTDVHPAQMSYDEMLSTFLDYAQAIKDVDPSAQVLGPAVSGWTGYFYSALDRGSDNFRTHADRRAHADMPFLPWWLDRIRQHDERTGVRTLDVLDVHYYPQATGVFSDASDPVTNGLRLRSTRSLWDPSYVDESWINQPIELIPRLRAWIDQYYPGTPLAINEWNWGADQTMNGALAIADVLGVFGREGVDMAAYWTFPPVGSPGAYAFAMYTNYDGHGNGFGDIAVADTSSAPDDVAAYASLDSHTADLLVMVINKRADTALPATVQVSPGFGSEAKVVRYDGDGPPLELSDVDVVRGQLQLELPAASISLLRLRPAYTGGVASTRTR